MNLQYLSISIPNGQSWTKTLLEKRQFEQMHTHGYYELNYFTGCEGKSVIGNRISRFKDGDLILLGPDLPHRREPDADCSTNRCLSIYIEPLSLVKIVTEIPDLCNLNQLLQLANYGLRFRPEYSKKMIPQMELLGSQSSSENYIHLLNILDELSNIPYEIVTVSPTNQINSSRSVEQIKFISQFILKNIHQNITLENAADLVNMAPGSFCRFFRHKTGKNFKQFVTETKIQIACKLLTETDKTIAQISAESGYNNLANFNLYFKNVMMMTPSAYRKQHAESKNKNF